MSLKYKLLASTVASLLLSANAGAVVLGVDPARAYAAELEDGTTLTDPADTVSFEVGYNFSDGEVRYGRFACTDNLTMAGLTVSTASPDLALGAINGQGTSAVFFSMTAGASPGATADDVIMVDATNTLEDGGDVSCEFAIYDQPSQAQAGGANGLVYTTGLQPFIERVPGFVFEFEAGDPDQGVADVEAALGAYMGFTPINDWANFANFRFQEVAGVLKADGTQVTIPDIFGGDTAIIVDGDFSAADNIWLWDNLSANWYWDSFDDDSASFTGVTIPLDAYLQYDVDDVDPIQESEYFATLEADANPGYVVADMGPIRIGEIVRNGTQLQAPLVQLPQGWLSRIAITNTGALARPYSLEVMTETGRTATVSPSTGTVPAGGTVVIDLADIVTFSHNRGTIHLNVAAPDNQIQGLYQIVNPVAGSLSNHVMVRPGTN